MQSRLKKNETVYNAIWAHRRARSAKRRRVQMLRRLRKVYISAAAHATSGILTLSGWAKDVKIVGRFKVKNNLSFDLTLILTWRTTWRFKFQRDNCVTKSSKSGIIDLS